jgi:hypothetical protein
LQELSDLRLRGIMAVMMAAVEMYAVSAAAVATFECLLNLRERLLRAREVAGLKVLAEGLEVCGESGDKRLRAGCRG